MSVLTGKEILRQMDLGNIKIEPCSREHVGTNSIDVHIGSRIRLYSYWSTENRTMQLPNLKWDIPGADGRIQLTSPLHRGRVYAIDSKKPPKIVDLPILKHPSNGEDCWLLEPGYLYLGCTIEHTETVGYVPRIDGRSSPGRLGIACHITAGLGDNGFKGTWTLEFFVIEPILIYPGQRLCQLSFDTLIGEQTFYGDTGNDSGRYQGQVEPEGTRLNVENE